MPWSLLYLLLVTAPLVLLLFTPVAPDGIAPDWDFAMALGFSGIAIMGLQFALTARFRQATAPFGVDVIYYFHRLVALAGVGLLIAHYAILRAGWAEALGPLNPFDARGHMTAGRGALLLFLAVIATSLWRRPLRIEYRCWRILHATVATLAFILAVIHIEGAGYYSHAPGVRWLWLAYTLFWALLIVYVRIARPWSIARRPWRVVEVRPERGRAWTLALEPVGHPGLRHAPGQFAWLTIGGSPFRFDEHPFSISSSAARGDDRIEFTIKALGDFTRTVGEVPAGAVAWIDGPHGVFTPDRYPDAPGLVFIAGGIGIAPVMAMLRTLADRADSRPLWLFNADSRWDDVTYREELESLGDRLDIRTITVIEHPPPGWGGRRGRITAAMLREELPENFPSLHYFVCGPKPMCGAVLAMLDELGVPRAQAHHELFDMV